MGEGWGESGWGGDSAALNSENILGASPGSLAFRQSFLCLHNINSAKKQPGLDRETYSESPHRDHPTLNVSKMCSVRYRYSRCRYGCRTEVTEVFGTGIDVVPNLPNCLVPVLEVY